MKKIIAVDPGVGGGFCIGEFGILLPMPETLVEIADLMMEHKESNTELWIEEIPKFTGKNRNESTTAVLFQNFGRVEGIAVALGMSIHRVTPKAWQSVLGIGIRGGMEHAAWKRKLKTKACELYPHQHITLKTADAILIWHYAKGGGR